MQMSVLHNVLAYLNSRSILDMFQLELDKLTPSQHEQRDKARLDALQAPELTNWVTLWSEVRHVLAEHGSDVHMAFCWLC